MRVAAYQAPLLPAGSIEAIGLIRAQVRRCEAEGVTVLCCPEAILGGLADYFPSAPFAIPADRLDTALAPLSSETVTAIVGFTELGDAGLLYNSAAVLQRGSVIGVYRKLHPAIRQSVYTAGSGYPVFQAPGLTFGVVICNDSNFSAPAARMAALGATALFVPTNNALPLARASPGIVRDARNADIARAVENGMWVIRADVAGQTDELLSYGSSGIVDPNGTVIETAPEKTAHLLIVEWN